MDNAIAPEDVAEAIEFIISRPDSVTISELGIKHIDS
jgi:NADP-dependent 3-hydroxy acid dehydrogenase YdfG